MKKTVLLSCTKIILALTLSACNTLTSYTTWFTHHSTTDSNDDQQEAALLSTLSSTTAEPSVIWQKLTNQPLAQLKDQAADDTNNSLASSWLKLAILSKEYSRDNDNLSKHLIEWQIQNPHHPAQALVNQAISILQSSPTVHKIALLLPMNGPMADTATIIKNGFLHAYYHHQDSTKPTLAFYDTSLTPHTSILSLYQQAITDGADVIIGPLDKIQVQELYDKAPNVKPILALNYTQVATQAPKNYFYQFGLLPELEAQQLAINILASKRSKAVLIASNNNLSHRMTKAFIQHWRQHGGTITNTIYLQDNTDFKTSLTNLLHLDQEAANNATNTQTTNNNPEYEAIVLFIPATMGKAVVPILKFYLLDTVPIYATTMIYDSKPNFAANLDLNGINIITTPWLIHASTHQNPTRAAYNNMYAVGYDAYILCRNLPRLSNLDILPIYGATGTIAMNAQQISQELAIATVRNGQLHALALPRLDT